MNAAGLLKHQAAPAEQLLAALEKHGGALDGSDLGVGKTAQALAVVRARKLPTLVVGPLVAEAGWRKLGAHLGTSFSYVNYEMLRGGNTPFGRWENPLPPGGLEVKFKCSTCQIKLNGDPRTWQKCPHHYLGIHCVERVKTEHNYGKFIFHNAIKQLVFDEVHRCSALDSLQSDMLVAGRRQRIDCLALSATVAENPLDFRALGYVLGLHHYVDFYQWAAKRGCRRVPWGGFQFLLGEEKRKQVMVQLHNEIFPEHGARVKIDDLGDEFPKVEITAELYDLAEADTISRLYTEMDEAISVLNGARGNDADAAHPLTTLIRARQEVELLKVPIFLELVSDALAGGYHVAICVNFRSTVDELCRRLKTKCRVDGSQTGTKGAARRRANIDAFQRDDEPIIVLSAAAGSASIDLQDVCGKYPRVGFGSLGVSAQQTRQWCGRLRRATGKSKALYRFVLAANTPEVRLHRELAGKLNQIDCLNDGDLWAANLPLTVGNITDIFPVDRD